MDSNEIYFNTTDANKIIKSQIIELRKQNCNWDSIQVYYWKLINDICYDVEQEEVYDKH